MEGGEEAAGAMRSLGRMVMALSTRAAEMSFMLLLLSLVQAAGMGLQRASGALAWRWCALGAHAARRPVDGET